MAANGAVAGFVLVAVVAALDIMLRMAKSNLKNITRLRKQPSWSYLDQFKELSKIAELKHKERKTLRKFRLFQLKSLKDNNRTLPDGRTWSQILSGAERGIVADILKLAESYAAGVPEGKIPQRPKDSLGWYLRAAVCGSVEAMKAAVYALKTDACGSVDAEVAAYWQEKLCRVASAENATVI